MKQSNQKNGQVMIACYETGKHNDNNQTVCMYINIKNMIVYASAWVALK